MLPLCPSMSADLSAGRGRRDLPARLGDFDGSLHLCIETPLQRLYSMMAAVVVAAAAIVVYHCCQQR